MADWNDNEGEKNMLTHYHIIPTFNTSGKESFRKHCGKRRKCSFSHNVFYSSQHKFQFLSHYDFVVRKRFEFGQDQNYVVW